MYMPWMDNIPIFGDIKKSELEKAADKKLNDYLHSDEIIIDDIDEAMDTEGTLIDLRMRTINELKNKVSLQDSIIRELIYKVQELDHQVNGLSRE